MMETKYKQCEIRKDSNVDWLWVESDKAIIGNNIKVKFDEGWSFGWKITDVYHLTEIDEKQLDISKNLYKNHRKGTDI